MWLPTGFGKSICFQTLPFVFYHKLGLCNVEKRSIVVVLAPLVALMADQVQSLRTKGVNAVIFSSEGRKDRVGTGLLASEDTIASASLIFSIPEALIQDRWRNLLERPVVSDHVCAVIVDETHCVSKWYVLELSTVSDIKCTISTLLRIISSENIFEKV